MILSELAKERQIKGARRSGQHAVKHRKGIHGLSSEERKKHARKGNNNFLNKWKFEEYRTLHRNKIRFGRVVARFSRIPKKDRESFGWR